jgi:hypothetical protein
MRLLHEFRLVTLEALLALKAAEVVGFPFISDFKLRCALVQHHAANWVSKGHILGS